MRRVISNNSVILSNADTVPNTGTPQYFTSGNPANSTPATVLPGWWCNEIQDELQSFIEASGVADDGTHWSQVWGLLFRSLTFADTGTANAKLAGPSGMTWPFQSAWLGLGTFIRVKIGTRNSGATTLNAFGTSALPVITQTGSALVGGELDANAIHDFVHNGIGSWICVSLPSSVSGRQTFTSSGTFTVPAGVFKVKVRAWGAGGGGGGAQSGICLSAAGGGGEYREGIFSVTPGVGCAVTIGAAGTGGTSAPAAGGAGGNTILGNGSGGTLIQANGGGGGQSSVSGIQTSFGAGGTGGSGGDTIVPGSFGGFGAYVAGTSQALVFVPPGGGAFCSPAPPPNVGTSEGNNVAGSAGNMPGVGGAGAFGAATNIAGAAGAAGLMIIEWLAGS